MFCNRRLSFAFAACAVLSVAMLGGRASAGPRESVLYNFTGGNDGGNTASRLVFDTDGNAYGTTVVGGTANCGTVFRLTSRGQGGGWHELVLYNFSCFADGKNPHGGLTIDSAGNLYGTTVAGGAGGTCTGDGCGVVFELTPAGERVLYNFTGKDDGFGPGGNVVFDGAGNLYGEAPDGGAHSAGTIFQLSPHGSTWQFNLVHAFTGGKDGALGSLGPLLVDAAGNLFGTTEVGGAHSAGTAFEASPGARGKWTLHTLYAFQGQPDAAFPYGGLIADASGNLFGTTYYGGAQGIGTVFELSPKARGPWTEHKLYDFKGGTDASSPTSTLVFDKAGNLFGTSSTGGHPGCDCGTIFRLAHNSWAERVLHRFGGSQDGADPYYGLTLGPANALYSTTVAGGLNNQGTVFAFSF